MNPLNDDELDALLRQAKPPQSSPGFAARVMRGYEEQTRRSTAWSWLLFRPVRIPAAFGVLAALLLLAVGAVVGRTLLAPTVIAKTRPPEATVIKEVPVIQERVVYRECNGPTRSNEPPAGGFTFNELQPVREIQPRVVRSIGDDR
jgi:hypothetical protein